MKFGVVVFPGSNCDRDLIHVLEKVLQQEVVVLWHKEKKLPDFNRHDCIMLPGGFSYGDYLRSGAIARFSPIMNAVVEFANSGGYVWGICNGFQILCEAGLLPGALLRNINQQFICKNIYITPADVASPLSHSLNPGSAYKIPIAHAEGRYYADQKTLSRLQQNKQIIFQYCDEYGQVNETGNPNGSQLNIAGICNETRNVFGMMPHPERASEEMLGNTDGKLLFDSFISYADALEVDVIDDLLR
ncbi:MAG: phosphoribosylformylglycinamidine synthase subunit PurQ [Chitinophagales bacterium]|nr:phosphoribosylformylglycinamidine synthase subunit PurQ [Chitinophagaceae bacterium]MBP9882125.1 phosphoribosylformylglycinamidine synthase subunit PurQ [Chitinophagales bacterium]